MWTGMGWIGRNVRKELGYVEEGQEEVHTAQTAWRSSGESQ